MLVEFFHWDSDDSDGDDSSGGLLELDW